jgi:hypothetical protein
MTSYNITVPVTVGYMFEVEAPEGLTRQQVMEMVTDQDIKQGEFNEAYWSDAAFYFKYEGGKDVEVADEDFNDIED